jgi:oligopeptidase B
VYGAYGLPTMMSTARWKPYLQAGFAVGFACVRGGGDHTESWAAEGQVEGKLLGIADFEASVLAMQKVSGVTAKRTVAYGRSAGGYIVGAAAAKPQRSFQAIYTEVPYVDVLRTASNPALPLTVYEYEEFGNPAASIADAELLVQISPVDAAITAVEKDAGAFDDLFVVCRTAQNDKNVYAYESLKWIDVLRSGERKSEEKLVHVDESSGHYKIGGVASFQRAEDFLLICKKILKRK